MKQSLYHLSMVFATVAIIVSMTSIALADSISVSVRVEVLTRGPVHEAFAQPVSFDEGAGFTAIRTPPEPIDEVIPYQKPEGDHILWIPGYWSWDVDRNDYIWISGCWRAVPPDTSWIPGYWVASNGGYQWIAGFWATSNTEELEYLPAPPATLEEGPQGAGSSNSIWIPGCWVRQDGRYAWRSGFWEAARADWVWEPSQYIYTPNGYIYVDGYWDYPLSNRGVMFLPVYCPPTLYGHAGYQYSPDIVFNLDVLTLNLFCSPQRHHYYFGDYYGAEYAQQDYHPWYEASDHHGWYDPIFVHQQWQHNNDHQWLAHQRQGYDQRSKDIALRPARTYTAMTAQVAHMPAKNRAQAQMAQPMKDVISAKTTPFKFKAVDAKTREASASQAKEVHAYKNKRAQWESPAAPLNKPLMPEHATTPPEKPRIPDHATTPPEKPRIPNHATTPPEKPLTPDHATVGKEPPASMDVSSRKVKIPRPPTAVHQPVRDKRLIPPPKPKQPQPDPKIQPRPKHDAPERAKDHE